MGLAISISLFIIIIDQITKYIILNTLEIGESIPIIKNFFSIFHIRNSGAAWGFLANENWGIHFLTIISIIASVFILYAMKQNDFKGLRIILAMILGGSVGNLIDRIRFNNVVDFLSFKFGNYYFPTFNVADMFIVLGVICLMLYFLINQDILDQVSLKKKKEEK